MTGQDATLAGQGAILAGQIAKLASQHAILADQDAILAGQDAILASQDAILAGQNAVLAGEDAILASQDAIPFTKTCYGSKAILTSLVSERDATSAGQNSTPVSLMRQSTRKDNLKNIGHRLDTPCPTSRW